ncbi:MAG: class I SAM-dependent methyltransferase [Candidatus Doudnabacteria bacterium]|nr:class I SAM-dependent methyltransferase [Candidatus Doudnabacteria bacterium]
MANFLPLKNYILSVSDKMIKKHDLTGPFLDVGGGRGDVSLHYATAGFRGVLVDRSTEAITAARKTLVNFADQVQVQNCEVADVAGTFNMAFLFDVLEHVEDDDKLLSEIWAKLNPGGTLLIVVPTNPSEWRWDDDYYGHLRRYDPEQLIKLLETKGFDVTANLDITFPFFWALRRIYTRFLTPRISNEEHALRRTEISSLNNSWHISPIINRLAQSMILWRPLLVIQPLFKNTTLGCERLFVARKS